MHKLGYLHRDVKPDNLAIGLNEKNKIIYLFDFGLALKIGSGTPPDEKGKVIGTLGFMSCRAH
jgi:serine/threonine protein kinase